MSGVGAVVEQHDERLARRASSRVDHSFWRFAQADGDKSGRRSDLAGLAEQGDGLADLVGGERFEWVWHGMSLIEWEMCAECSRAPGRRQGRRGLHSPLTALAAA